MLNEVQESRAPTAALEAAEAAEPGRINPLAGTDGTDETSHRTDERSHKIPPRPQAWTQITTTRGQHSRVAADVDATHQGRVDATQGTSREDKDNRASLAGSRQPCGCCS